MPLPIITRGFGVRDDYLDANVTTLASASVTTNTFTSNGDTLAWNVTMTNPNNGDFAIVYRPVTGPDPSKYSNAILRWYSANWPNSNFQIRPYIAYTPSNVIDSGQSSLATFTPGFTSVNFPLTLGKALVGNTINQIGFQVLCASTSTGTFNMQLLLDFVYVQKEVLTLSSVRQPISLRKRRNTVEIPILQREGGVLQDLGSASWDITVGGHLVSSTAGVGQWTNTYTADQWWYLLTGLALETGSVQSDGNPTWQWFQSDQIQAKVLVTDCMPQQPMGRVQFWDYALQLKKFDILSETTLGLPNYTTGAFWDLGPGPGGLAY